jgi:hypothetical protein
MDNNENRDREAAARSSEARTRENKDHVTVTIRNTHRNPYHIATGHPDVPYVDVESGKEVTAEVHRDQMRRLRRQGFEVKESSERRENDDGTLKGHGDYSEVNQNVAFGVQASDKNTIDPAQRMTVAAASGDYNDLQGVARGGAHGGPHLEGTAAQTHFREEAEVNNPTLMTAGGSPSAGAPSGGDSIDRLLADVEAESVNFGQLRSRAKTLLGDDFPVGYSPKKDEIVELLHAAQRKKAQT